MLASNAPSWRANAISSRPPSTMAMLDGEPISVAFSSAGAQCSSGLVRKSVPWCFSRVCGE